MLMAQPRKELGLRSPHPKPFVKSAIVLGTFLTSYALFSTFPTTNIFRLNKRPSFIPGFISSWEQEYEPMPPGYANVLPYSAVDDTNVPLNESCFTKSPPPPLMIPSPLMPPAIQDYIQFHAEAKSCLLNSACINKPEIIVWTCIRGYCGGLGDRIRFARIACFLAMVTNRLFFIKWNKNEMASMDVIAALVPAYINWTLPENELNEYFHTNVSQVDVRFNFLVTNLEFVNPFPTRNDSEEELLNLKETDFTKLFKQWKIILLNPRFYSNDIEHLANNPNSQHIMRGFPVNLTMLQFEKFISLMLFAPSASTSKLARQRTFQDNRPYIAVHLRTGFDHGGDDNTRFAPLKEQGIDILAERVIACFKRMDARTRYNRLFVASDGKDLKQRIEVLGKQHGIDVKSDGSGFSYHLDFSPSESYEGRGGTCVAFLEVFADMYGLAGASKLFFLFSGFPRVAMSLGNVGKWAEIEPFPSDGMECSPQYMSSMKKCNPMPYSNATDRSCYLQDHF